MNPLDRPNEILVTTLEFKEMKRILYESAIRRCSERSAIELFSFLRDQESERLVILEKTSSEIETGGAASGLPAMRVLDRKRVDSVRRAIFGEGDSAPPGAEDLIAVNNALNMQQACLQFYTYALQEATEPSEREFLGVMLSEGREYMALLSDLALQFSIRGKRNKDAEPRPVGF